jgi:hypothetical protein
MQVDEFIHKLTAYFSGEYKPVQIERMEAVARNISEASLDEVYASLEEECDSRFKVSVKQIVEACRRLNIGHGTYSAIRWRMVECMACGTSYKYHPSPDDEDKLERQLFDVCPRCGFQYRWQQESDGYEKANMPNPIRAFVQAQIEHSNKTHGPGMESHYKPAKEREANKLAEIAYRARVLETIGGLTAAKSVPIDDMV